MNMYKINTFNSEIQKEIVKYAIILYLFIVYNI